jgi:aryl-alcohol dehydrogenase-like predicted oxidoreductase
MVASPPTPVSRASLEREVAVAMRYTTFGRRTGLRVSQFALGAGNFGIGPKALTAPGEAAQIFDRFVGAGGNFIDTADAYQGGESEQLIGDFIRADRDELVVATKFTVGAGPLRSLARTGNSRKNLRISVEGSLKNLGTEYVDLLWVHFPDELTPVEELVAALDELVTQGKILYAAFSNFPAWRVSRAVTIADLTDRSPIAGVQIEYSLVERTADREVLPMAEALGLGVTMWSPLGGGLLSGKYRQSNRGRLTDVGRLVHTETTRQKSAIVDAVLDIAGELDRTPAQVATAWVNERSRRLATASVPIIGPRDLRQLDEYLAALEIDLTHEQYERLTDLSAIPLGIPHEANAEAKDRLQGGASAALDGPLVPVA